jgi:hypothetical protein
MIQSQEHIFTTTNLLVNMNFILKLICHITLQQLMIIRRGHMDLIVIVTPTNIQHVPPTIVRVHRERKRKRKNLEEDRLMKRFVLYLTYM